MDLFSTLPTELRLLIFSFAITSQSKPRVHSILSSRKDASKFISNQPISSLLHTCHASRSLFFSSQKLTFAYGTYLNFDVDTIFLADCPRVGCTRNAIGSWSGGFEACKELGTNERLMGKIKRLAVNEEFWVRPNRIERSLAVEAWNVVLKGGMVGLEELVVVFDEAKGLESQDMEDEKRRVVRFKTVGWYTDGESEVGERQRRCDDFLRLYLGYFSVERRCAMPRISYVVAIVDRE